MSYQFPLLTEKNKGEDYHVNFAKAILHNCVTDSYVKSNLMMRELYKFLDEGTPAELTAHLQKAEDGSDLPAFWITANTIRSKVDILLGELESRGYDIKVKALNKEAIDRKLEEKEKLRVKSRLKSFVEFLENETGLPLEDKNQYIPDTEEELNEYFDLSFKDKAEIFMESALKFLAQRNLWDEERKLLFRDLLAVNRAIVRNDIVRGVPVARRVSPLCFLFDPNSKDEFLRDSSYFVELHYMPLTTVAERYGLTKDEVDRLSTALGNVGGIDPIQQKFVSVNDNIFGGRLSWVDLPQKMILVAHCVWRDYDELKHKRDINPKYGTEHIQEVKGGNSKSDKIIYNKIEVWRQCTIIGGDIVRDWGKVPNQARELSSLETALCPYTAWIPGLSTGRGVSKVEQVVGLQVYRDLTMYNMNVALTRVGAKGIIYDAAMMPEGWSPQDVIKHMKVFGVAFVNSKQSNLLNKDLGLFKEFDMTLSQTIGQYLNIMAFYDSEIERITGVSAERMGQLQAPTQPLGVLQSALVQSQLVTASLFTGFERLCTQVLNHQAKLVKIVFPKLPEVFAPIVGDTGIDFFKEHIDIDLDEFGVFVESLPKSFMDRSKLEQMMMIALQSDPELLDDLVAIMLEPDTKVALRMFQRKRALRKIYLQQQQMYMAERDAQLQEQMRQLDEERNLREIESQLRAIDLKNQGNINRAMVTGRVKLSQEKIRALTELLKQQSGGRIPPDVANQLNQ